MPLKSDNFTAYDHIPLPVFVFDIDSNRLIYKNTSSSGILNNPSGDITLKEFAAYINLPYNDILNEKENSADSKLLTHIYSESEGETVFYEIKKNRIRSDKSNIILITFIRIDNGSEDSIILKEFIRLGKLLHKIVGKNNSVPTNDIPELINESLGLIGSFFKGDRTYICTMDSESKTLTKFSDWFSPDTADYGNEDTVLEKDEVKWSLDKIFNEGLLVVNEFNDLPAEAVRERELMKRWNVKSYIILPINLNNGYKGYLGIEHVKHDKKWTEHEINSLRFITGNIANLIIRYRKESFLQEKEKLYQSLFLSANDSILIFEDGICIDCSEKALDLFHCKKEELVGIKGVDLAPEAEKYSAMKVKDELFSDNSVFIPEFLIKRPDGTTFFAEISLSRIEINNSNYTIVIYRDISETKKSLNKLKAKESYLQNKLEQLLSPSSDIDEFSITEIFEVDQLQKLQDAIVEALGVSSYFADADGIPVTKPTGMNKICDMILATPEGKAECHKTAILLQDRSAKTKTPEYLHCLTCGFIDAYAPIIVDGKRVGSWIVGQVIPQNYHVDDLDEQLTPLGIDIQKVKKTFNELHKFDDNHLKKILNLLSVLSNELSTLGYNNLKLAKTIREHLVLEKELRASKEKAEESDRLKSAFLANLSHEIRTPMNGIVGFSDLLDINELSQEERMEYVKLIKQSSNQLLNIINDIVDISKIEAGQVDIKKSTFNLNSMLNEIHMFFSRQIEDKNIELLIDVPDKDDKTIQITSDEIKLRQILNNLLSNAIKFTDYGYVKMGYELQEDYFLFFVEDTGIGIDSDHLNEVFDRFWQSEHNKNNKGGTGLGLAITKAYVELLGGEISVTSEPGKGSRFQFSIPQS
jgi:PAS domain S-box-containing protein